MYKVFIYSAFSDDVSMVPFANRVSAQAFLDGLLLDVGQWAEMHSPWGLLSIKDGEG